MKPIINSILFLLIFVSFVGCEKANEPNELLIGHWINPSSIYPHQLTLIRADALKENEYGISFLNNNNYVERSHGFCGTPPLVYNDLKGTWQKNDANITVNMGYMEQTWEIIRLNEDSLVVKQY